MPKAPILDRTIFYDTLRDGTLRFLQWNLVNTELGAMIEPRQLSIESGKLTNLSRVDASFNRMAQMNEDTFASNFGTGGQQLPYDPF